MQQELDADGHVFDVDCPGAQFDEADAVGARHRWQFYAQQFVAIGPCPDFQKNEQGRVVGIGPWAIAGQRRTRVSPFRRWRADLVAIVRARGVPMERAPSVEWEPGQPHSVTEAEETNG